MVKKIRSIAMPYTGMKIDTVFNLNEALKSQIDMDVIKYPRDLGERHPFEFSQADKICASFGLARAAVDKHLDFIISPGFRVTSKNKKAELLITKLIDDTGMTLIVRDWIEEGLMKGNGFMEIDIEKDTVHLKVVNANNMYVKRKRNGEIINFNQYIGDVNKFSMEKVISFKPEEMAHLPIGKISDSAYGLGIIRPAMKIIENIVRSEKSMHVLLDRKANNPIICKVGTAEEPATQNDVSTIGAKFEYLNNYHEWAFDHRVDFSVVDFGAIADKFEGPLNHDKQSFYMAVQVPAVLMGDSQQNEGIAIVQKEVFNRRIVSLQEQIERIMEQQIFKPFLNLNGLDVHVEVEWNLPDEATINERIVKLTTLVQSMLISPQLRVLIERDLAKTLGYDEKDIDKLPKLEDVPEVERDAEGNIKQPEIPGEKPNSSESLTESWNFKQEVEESEDLSVEEFINLNEFSGFNYRQFKQAILKQVRTDEFRDLKAVNEIQINEGLLSDSEVKELRKILLDGFKKNKSIVQIESDLDNSITFRDRLVEGKIVLPAEKRSSVITRTETVRLSNEGIVNMYKKNDIKEVRWLSSISDRTCPRCLNLDGKIFNINELSVGVSQPPLHPNCRCGLLSVT